MIALVVICCRTYKTACEAFKLFLEFLNDNEPWSISKIFEHENCVETDDDLRYIFIDYRFEKVFENMKPDIIDVQEFFEEINELYFHDQIIDYYDL